MHVSTSPSSAAAADSIDVTLNGRVCRLPAQGTVQAALQSLDLAGKRYAVELNGVVVPKSQHGATRLADGDRLEVVIAVGGG